MLGSCITNHKLERTALGQKENCCLAGHQCCFLFLLVICAWTRFPRCDQYLDLNGLRGEHLCVIYVSAGFCVYWIVRRNHCHSSQIACQNTMFCSFHTDNILRSLVKFANALVDFFFFFSGIELKRLRLNFDVSRNIGLNNKNPPTTVHLSVYIGRRKTRARLALTQANR